MSAAESGPIDIRETRFSWLSPFSAHAVEVWGELFPTAEHAYQAARLRPGPEREAVRSARSPLDAWRLGQRYKDDPRLRTVGFDKDAAMEEIFRAKLAQHPDIREILQETGDRELLKVIDTDEYWGTGAEGKGQNKMGRLWMKLRAEMG